MLRPPLPALLLVLALALALPAAAHGSHVASEPVMAGQTAKGEPYRVLLEPDEEDPTDGCLTPQLQWSGETGDHLCFYGGDDTETTFDAAVATLDRRPWLTYGVASRAVARVRVVYDDLTTADAQLVDPSSNPHVRLFHLPVPAGRTVKIADAFDAAGKLAGDDTGEEGPYRLLHAERIRRNLSMRLSAGWSLRAGDLAPRVCVEVGARLKEPDGHTGTATSDCTAAASARPWWTESEVPVPGTPDRIAARVLYGGVDPAVRRVRLHLSGGRAVTVATRGGRRLAGPVRAHLRLWSLTLPARSRARVRRVTGLSTGGKRLFSKAAVRRLSGYERFCRANPGAC